MIPSLCLFWGNVQRLDVVAPTEFLERLGGEEKGEEKEDESTDRFELDLFFPPHRSHFIQTWITQRTRSTCFWSLLSESKGERTERGRPVSGKPSAFKWPRSTFNHSHSIKTTIKHEVQGIKRKKKRKEELYIHKRSKRHGQRYKQPHKSKAASSCRLLMVGVGISPNTHQPATSNIQQQKWSHESEKSGRII